MVSVMTLQLSADSENTVKSSKDDYKINNAKKLFPWTACKTDKL